MKVRAFIADDEPLARRKLRDLLAPFAWIECVGEAADGTAAVAEVDRLCPDVLFLDVRMPGLTGLEVLQRIRHTPHVILTTAYDGYAVAAFELQALDYLLKPFGRERLAKALERVRRLTTQAASSSTLDRARDALAAQGPMTRLFVRERGNIVQVEIAGIERLEAQGDYVMLYAGKRSFLVHARLRDILARLDPDRFVQVHRSHVVNMDFVLALAPYDPGRLEVQLRSGSKIVASRTGSKVLRQWVF